VMDTLGLAHAEDRHDVGMVQPGRGPRLAAEPLPLVLVQEALVWERLPRPAPRGGAAPTGSRARGVGMGAPSAPRGGRAIPAPPRRRCPSRPAPARGSSATRP